MDLQDAKGIVEQFYDLQFTVDSTNPDTMLSLSGYEMKAAIGTPKHIQPSKILRGFSASWRRNSTKRAAR